MHFFTLSTLAALSFLSSSVQAASLTVQTGCITYRNNAGQTKGLCHGSTGTNPDISVHINACIDVSTGTSGCALNIDDINLSQNIYWGTDNCLYYAGPPASKITCATPVNPPVKLACGNPYAGGCKRSLRIAREE